MSGPRAMICEGDDLETTITERVTKLAWPLSEGEGIRTVDAARLTGMTVSGVRRMLKRMSRVAPIYCDDEGFWQRCEMLEIDF